MNANQHKSARAVLAASAVFAAVLASAGIKYWDSPDYRAFDVDCYVPGAVWNYDGIRNQGADKPHSDTATTWKNLGSNTGFGGDSSLSKISIGSGGDGEWTDDGYIFNGGTRWKGSAKVTVAGDFTVQMLVDADAAEQINTTGFAPACSVMLDNFAFGIYSKGSFIFRVNGDNNGPKITTESGKYDYANVIRDDTNRKAYLFSGTEMPESGEGYRQYATAIGSKSTTGYGLGSTSNSGQQFVGKLKFFRLYQGILSSEELAWNRVVDEARFFNRVAPLPVTNAVVVSAVAASVEPSGTYAVDGSHVFTAPRVATVGNAKYICTGYTLEEWDDATGDWGAAVFHARELSCKVEDADCVRITWKWMDADGLVTYDVSDYVWTGLEVFYDGICNVGTNAAHDATALTWKNLGSKGAPNDMFLQLLNAGGTAWTTAASLAAVDGRDPGEWTADGDGFALKGDSRFRCNSATDNKIIVGTDYSLQMLLDANAAAQKDSSAFLFSLNANNFSLGLYKSGSIKWRNDSDPWNSSADDRALIMTGTEFGYLTAIMDSEALTTTLFSGTARPTSGTVYHTHDTLKGHSEGGYDLGGYGNNNYDKLLVGTLKSFRQYDHALSPAEVLQNRKVDDFRFFGKPVAEDVDVIVQSTYSALQGNEPDGEYDVDGSHTFTAPESVTIKVNDKKITYACDGYTVEVWGALANKGDGWSVATHYTGNSYAYTATAGKVRLTWKWKATYGCRTSADYSFADYSQAGIVWNFDGIYNQGVGVERSTTATTWKNLAPNPVTSELFVQRINSARNNYANSSALSNLDPVDGINPGEWTEDGFRLKGDSRWRGLGQVGPVANWTLQTLVDADVADVVNDIMYVISASWSNFAVVLRKNKSVANSFHFNVQDTQGYANRPYIQNASGKYDYATAILDSSDRTAKMFQGVTPPVGGTIADGYYQFSSPITPFTDTNFGFGASTSYNEYFIGTMKSIRYYDRVLTEEELVRNRNVDSARYFGKLGVTNVVVGTEAYKVEGSWTFTPPALVDGKAVVGYYTEELVNGEWTNKKWNNGTEYTYAEATANGKTIRLTWSGPRPGMMIIVK